MANSVCEVLVTEAALQRPDDDGNVAAGAVVDFSGVVRNLEGDGLAIEGIDYECHKTMAEHQMRVIADAAAEKFRLKQVMLHHRIGFVRAGEASLFLRVSAPHRGAAFEASQWIVGELKKRVPIWKKLRLPQAESGHAVAQAKIAT